MIASAEKCECCKEDSDRLYAIDHVLGAICQDCCDGVLISAPYLARNCITGIYTGPCGDNEEVAQ